MASGTPVIAAEGGQLKEFFLIGEHGYLWEPDNIDSAEDAVRRAMKNRDYLSVKARQQALKHSWDSASDQLNDIYYDAVKKHRNRNKEKTQQPMNIFIYLCRLFYYGLNWAFCMFLALSLMAPFVRVSSPQAKATQMNDKNNNNNYRNKHYCTMTERLS